MRRLTVLVLLAVLLAGCDRSSAETAVAFAILFGTLARIFVDSDAR